MLVHPVLTRVEHAIAPPYAPSLARLAFQHSYSSPSTFLQEPLLRCPSQSVTFNTRGHRSCLPVITSSGYGRLTDYQNRSKMRTDTAWKAFFAAAGIFNILAGLPLVIAPNHIVPFMWLYKGPTPEQNVLVQFSGACGVLFGFGYAMAGWFLSNTLPCCSLEPLARFTSSAPSCGTGITAWPSLKWLWQAL